MPQLNWGTGLSAALYGIALGLLENQRQAKEDTRKMKIDEERQARHTMGQLLIKAASEGQDISPLMKSPSAIKMFDEGTLNALNTMATTTRQARQQQEAALGFGPTPAPATPPPPMAGAPPLPAAGPPAPATFRPAMPPAPLGAAGGGMTIEQPTPARAEPNPAMLVAGAMPTAPPTQVSDVEAGAQKPALPSAEPVVETGPTPASTAAKPVAGREVAHDRQVADLASFNYYKPGELKRTGEGVSVSMPKIGGGTISMRGPTEEELGRRIFARAQERGYGYAAAIDTIVQKGAKIPDDLRAYGAQLAEREYAVQLRQMTGGGERTPTGGEARQAAQNAFLKTGYISDMMKPLLIPSKDDETRLWTQVFQSAIDSGKGMAAATSLANATGAVPDVAVVQMMQDTFKAEMKAAIDKDPLYRNLSEEQKTKLLGAATGFLRQTPEERAAVAEKAPMAPGTAAKRFEETGRVPRLSDLPGEGGGDLTATRKRAEAEAVAQTAGAAAAKKAAEQAIADKPTAVQQEKAEALAVARLKAMRILQKYEAFGTKVGGVFGSQTRLADLKAKLNDEQQAEVAQMLSDAKLLRSNILHALSGAQSGYRDPYLDALPDVMGTSNTTFKAQMRATIQNIEDLQAVAAEIQKKSGVIPPGGTPTKPPLVNPYK